MTVRRARPDEGDRVRALVQRVVDETYGGVVGQRREREPKPKKRSRSGVPPAAQGSAARGHDVIRRTRWATRAVPRSPRDAMW